MTNFELRELIFQEVHNYASNMEDLLGDERRMLYRRTIVKIPTPEYYVLYNGTDEMPEKKELRLSDSFLVPAQGYEWTAYMLNINAGHNAKIMRHCPELNGYAELIRRIREEQSRGIKAEEAVSHAVEQCIRDGILADYLRRLRGEAIGMLLTEFNEKEWEETVREESREEGRQEGRQEGISIGSEMLARLLQQLTPGSEEFNRALYATEEERRQLYKEYKIIAG